MLEEVEQAAMNVEAQARLSQIRSQLGLDSAPQPPTQAAEAPTPATQTEPGQPAAGS